MKIGNWEVGKWCIGAAVPVLSLIVYIVGVLVDEARWEATLPDDATELLLGIYREAELDLLPEEIRDVSLEEVERDCWMVTFEIAYLTGEYETIEGTLTYDPDKEELWLSVED